MVSVVLVCCQLILLGSGLWWGASSQREHTTEEAAQLTEARKQNRSKECVKIPISFEGHDSNVLVFLSRSHLLKVHSTKPRNQTFSRWVLETFCIYTIETTLQPRGYLVKRRHETLVLKTWNAWVLNISMILRVNNTL